MLYACVVCCINVMLYRHRYIGNHPTFCNHTDIISTTTIIIIIRIYYCYSTRKSGNFFLLFIPRRIYLRDIQMMAELIHESDIAGGNELGKITGVEAFRVLYRKKDEKKFFVYLSSTL